jgi:hypothetical protein
MIPFVQKQTFRQLDVTHVAIDSTKPFANVEAFLEAVVPPIEFEHRLEDSPELVIFLKRERGAQVVQYEIGNPLIGSTVARYNQGASLYVPLRVLLYENDNGGSRFEYDLPSSLFVQFDNDRIAEVARALDDALERALTAAAG